MRTISSQIIFYSRYLHTLRLPLVRVGEIPVTVIMDIYIWDKKQNTIEKFLSLKSAFDSHHF